MDQIPRLCDLLSPAVDALLGDLTGARRAARERYAQSGPTGGRFGDVIRGWRGQAEVIRARLTKEVMATRLDRCSGQELKDLAKSEYFAELPNQPMPAVGQVTLVRLLTNTSSSPTGQFPTGIIPAGTKIKKSGNPPQELFFVGTQDAEYVTTEPLVCGADDVPFAPDNNFDGTWTHRQQLVVSIQATRPGPHANVPIYQLAQDATSISGNLFDPTFKAGIINAAGGTLGVVDDQIRALARALSVGSNGPTQTALVAGALTNQGVRHAVHFNDAVSALATLFVADESWAYSDNYGQAVLQGLQDTWLGWGCRARVLPVTNIPTIVAPTIVLRDPRYVTAQLDITANVKIALAEYFDNRPDFYTWTLNAIGAVIGGADARILACTAVSVSDALLNTLIAAVDGIGVITGTEPSAAVTPFFNQIFHYALAGVQPAYQTPGT